MLRFANFSKDIRIECVGRLKVVSLPPSEHSFSPLSSILAVVRVRVSNDILVCLGGKIESLRESFWFSFVFVLLGNVLRTSTRSNAADQLPALFVVVYFIFHFSRSAYPFSLPLSARVSVLLRVFLLLLFNL